MDIEEVGSRLDKMLSHSREVACVYISLQY